MPCDENGTVFQPARMKKKKKHDRRAMIRSLLNFYPGQVGTEVQKSPFAQSRRKEQHRKFLEKRCRHIRNILPIARDLFHEFL